MEKTPSNNTQDVEVRKGPWTMEEDLILINYIVNHGEGVWNSLARSAGLKRTGKSCRLRWLNYLRPDVRRGNITQEEQQLIMELHARWGNRTCVVLLHEIPTAQRCFLSHKKSANSAWEIFSESFAARPDHHVQIPLSHFAYSLSLFAPIFPNATAVGIHFSR